MKEGLLLFCEIKLKDFEKIKRILVKEKVAFKLSFKNNRYNLYLPKSFNFKKVV